MHFTLLQIYFDLIFTMFENTTIAAAEPPKISISPSSLVFMCDAFLTCQLQKTAPIIAHPDLYTRHKTQARERRCRILV